MGKDTQFGFGEDLLKFMREKKQWGVKSENQWLRIIEDNKGDMLTPTPTISYPAEGKILILSILSLLGKIFSPGSVTNWNIALNASTSVDAATPENNIVGLYYKCIIDFKDSEGLLHKGTEIRVKFVNQQFRSGTSAYRAFPNLHTDYGELFPKNAPPPGKSEAWRHAADFPGEASMDVDVLTLKGYCLINLWVNLTQNTLLYSNSLALMDKRAVNDTTNTESPGVGNHTLITNVDLNHIYT